MAQKFKLKADLWNRSEKHFEDKSEELKLDGFIVDMSDTESMKAFASKAATLLLRGYKLSAYLYVDRSELTVNVEDLFK